MLCLICIILFLATLIGYYFFGPIALVFIAIGIFYFSYKKVCADKCKKIRGDKNGK